MQVEGMRTIEIRWDKSDSPQNVTQTSMCIVLVDCPRNPIRLLDFDILIKHCKWLNILFHSFS